MVSFLIFKLRTFRLNSRSFCAHTQSPESCLYCCFHWDWWWTEMIQGRSISERTHNNNLVQFQSKQKRKKKKEKSYSQSSARRISQKKCLCELRGWSLYGVSQTSGGVWTSLGAEGCIWPPQKLFDSFGWWKLCLYHRYDFIHVLLPSDVRVTPSRFLSSWVLIGWCDSWCRGDLTGIATCVRLTPHVPSSLTKLSEACLLGDFVTLVFGWHDISLTALEIHLLN